MVFKSKLFQYERHLQIKKLILSGYDVYQISLKMSMDFNYLKNQLIPKILSLSIDEIEALIDIEKNKQIGKKDKKTRNKPSKEPKVFYNENNVPIVLQGIFKTEQDYMNYLLNQYRQGFNR